MSNEKQKSKKSVFLLILLLVIIIAVSISGYYLFTKWLPDSGEISEASITSPPASISPAPQITSSPSDQPVSETPSPVVSVEPTQMPTPTPTSEPESTPTPKPTPTPVPLPSATTVPTVTYTPAPPIPTSTPESDENYGFNPTTVIEIENSFIKDGINDTLAGMGYSRKEDITISDLLKLESLIIVPREEEFDASELNCCRDSLGNLTVIHNDDPWNLEFLIYAKNLKAIYCFNNKISKITAISNLENLIYVGFPECNINSLSFIKNLNSLTGINFNFNQITTFSQIKDMKYLRSIRLVGNMLYNLNPFDDADYLDINDIWLWGNKLTDISPISSITNLQWLAIGDNDIDDLTPLLSLDNLKELYVDNKQSEKHHEILNELKNRGCNIVIY